MDSLLNLMAFIQTLRQAQGCAWTREQTPQRLAAHTLEECYELMDAIDSQDPDKYCDELSDLLYHILLYTEIGREQGLFTLNHLAEKALAKHHARMPLDWDQRLSLNAEQANAYWQEQKWKQRQIQGQKGLLHGLEPILPAHLAAYKMQKRLAAAHINWPEQEDLGQKITNLAQTISNPADVCLKNNLQTFFGDLLFTCIALGQSFDIDPETALREANKRFKDQVEFVEKKLAEENRKIDQLTTEEIQALLL